MVLHYKAAYEGMVVALVPRSAHRNLEYCYGKPAVGKPIVLVPAARQSQKSFPIGTQSGVDRFGSVGVSIRAQAGGRNLSRGARSGRRCDHLSGRKDRPGAVVTHWQRRVTASRLRHRQARRQREQYRVKYM